jgi:hypothetical protein
MRGVFFNRTYRRVFGAQVVALLGTGLLTVALALLAFDIAGEQAGVVLGTALTIKMVAYVVVSPLVAAAAHLFRPKLWLIGADVVRASVALTLPFVTEVWHVYLLILVLQSASAAFTPTFQAIIPEVLPDERQYTRALSLSRLAYDLESLASPAIAAALLSLLGYSYLFVGTATGFAASALLVSIAALPPRVPSGERRFLDRLTRGVRIFWNVRELRSLLALNLAVAAAGAMVIVNTVVYVRAVLDRPESDLAVLFAAFGAGSMVVALALPSALDRVSDRLVMLGGGLALPVGLVAAAAVTGIGGPGAWAWSLLIWFALGAATSLILTPSARLLRRASSPVSRPAVFAAQFSLSHACFMVTYPLAGILATRAGLATAALVLAAIAFIAAGIAAVTWAQGPTGSTDPAPSSR